MKNIMYITCVLSILSVPVLSQHIQQGHDITSPDHEWFKSQHNQNGESCCYISDGFVLEQNEWKITNGFYEVKIKGTWYKIEPYQVITPKSPNPIGKAIVWYLTLPLGEIRIFCFIPESLV